MLLNTLRLYYIRKMVNFNESSSTLCLVKDHWRHCRLVLCDLWKVHQTLTVLITRHLSAKVHGKVFIACVRSTMLRGSASWGTNASDLQQLIETTAPWATGSMAPKLRRNTLGFTAPETWHRGYYGRPSPLASQMVWTFTACHVLYHICHRRFPEPEDEKVLERRG